MFCLLSYHLCYSSHISQLFAGLIWGDTVNPHLPNSLTQSLRPTRWFTLTIWMLVIYAWCLPVCRICVKNVYDCDRTSPMAGYMIKWLYYWKDCAPQSGHRRTVTPNFSPVRKLSQVANLSWGCYLVSSWNIKLVAWKLCLTCVIVVAQRQQWIRSVCQNKTWALAFDICCSYFLPFYLLVWLV